VLISIALILISGLLPTDNVYLKEELKKRACQEWCALFVCIVKCRRVKYLQESPMMFGVMS
jgi:hypothetical protein